MEQVGQDRGQDNWANEIAETNHQSGNNRYERQADDQFRGRAPARRFRARSFFSHGYGSPLFVEFYPGWSPFDVATDLRHHWGLGGGIGFTKLSGNGSRSNKLA